MTHLLNVLNSVIYQLNFLTDKADMLQFTFYDKRLKMLKIKYFQCEYCQYKLSQTNTRDILDKFSLKTAEEVQ